MFHKNWKKEVFTLPNLLSLLRLVMVAFYARIYLSASDRKDYLLAGSIMALSCLTDLADGWIARRFRQITTLGKILDPLADKVTQAVVIWCLSLRYPVLEPVLALLLVKELFQLWAGLVFLRKGQMLPGALLAGKVCTAVLFLSLTALVLFPELPAGTVRLMALTDGGVLLLSFGSYVTAYFGKSARVRDL